jgi:ABC-type multidrug transport system ATPase subunit
MLTGMQKPTSGAAKAFGIDLFEGKTSSNFISVCHQHNVLLFKMSVFENL